MSSMFKLWRKHVLPPESESTGSAPSLEAVSSAAKPLHGLLVLSEGLDPVVDIVAIHGLGGHREKTWTASNGVNWLREFLPEDLPRARIMSWGYDAKWYAVSDPSWQYLYDHGRTLVSELCRKRKITQSTTRPIIFIAHSLGGIVLKSALIHSDSARTGALYEQRSFKLSTFGIFFMGTPHQGANGVQLGRVLANIASLGQESNDRIFQHLERDSEWLQQQLGQYAPISSDFVTKFAYEEYETPTMLGYKLMIVPKASAVVPGHADAEPLVIHADHKSMVRFMFKEDPGYVTVSEHLQIMVADIGENIQNRWDNEARLDEVRAQTSQRLPAPTIPRLDYEGRFSYSSLEPVRAYVPRPELTGEIRDQLDMKYSGTHARVLVVFGSGGTGKTQLLLDYAQRFQSDYKATFWINAGQKQWIERDFNHIFHNLFAVQSMLKPGQHNINEVVNLVKGWFDKENRRCLMVFDAADVIDNPSTDYYVDIKHFLPTAPSLDIIITTRSRSAEHMTRLDAVEVDCMDNVQSAELFNKYAKLSLQNEDVQNEVVTIVKELGHLALAIALAGTYVGSTPRLRSNIKQYLPEFRQRRREILSRKPQELVHQYSESILTTWETSFKAVINECSEAQHIMTAMSFLSYDDITLDLFDNGREVKGLQPIETFTGRSWPSTLFTKQPAGLHKLEECFEAMQKFSFVRWKDDPQSYSLHKLVHAWGQDRLNAAEQRAYTLLAFRLLYQATMTCRNSGRSPSRLVPHIMANYSIILSTNLEENDFDLLEGLREVGLSLLRAGWDEEGVRLIRHSHMQYKRLLGDSHKVTLSSLSILAGALHVYSDQQRIMELHQDGDKASKSAGSMARTLSEESLGMFKEAFEKTRKLSGDQDPMTLSTKANFAKALANDGQTTEALDMFKDVIDTLERVLGKEHCQTLTTTLAFASVLLEAGQEHQGIELFRSTVKMTDRVQDEEQLQMIWEASLKCAHKLDKRNSSASVELLREIHDKAKRALGEDHPETVAQAADLEAWLQYQQISKKFSREASTTTHIFSRNHTLEDSEIALGVASDWSGEILRLAKDSAARQLREFIEVLQSTFEYERFRLPAGSKSLVVPVVKARLESMLEGEWYESSKKVFGEETAKHQADIIKDLLDQFDR